MNDPTCYVCGRPVAARTLHEQLAARRALNDRVGIGGGLHRHTYCEPGSLRWWNALTRQPDRTERDNWWLRIFTHPDSGRPYAEIARKASGRLQDESDPGGG